MNRQLSFVPYLLYLIIGLEVICSVMYILQIYNFSSLFLLLLCVLNGFGLLTAFGYKHILQKYERKMLVRGDAVFCIKGEAEYNGTYLPNMKLYVFDRSLALLDDLDVIYFNWKYSNYDMSANLIGNCLWIDIYDAYGVIIDTVAFYSNPIQLQTLYDVLQRYSVNLDAVCV